MSISIIAAMTKARVIGKDNKLPWHIPEDLQHFKKITMGKTIVIGRKTFDSMNRKLLPGRKTVVLTRDKDLIADGFSICHSVQDVLQLVDGNEEIMIVGGAYVYEQFLPLAKKMYLSIVPGNYEGDVFFPEYDEGGWVLVDEQVKKRFVVRVLERG